VVCVPFRPVGPTPGHILGTPAQGDQGHARDGDRNLRPHLALTRFLCASVSLQLASRLKASCGDSRVADIPGR
jgi:hypothetical protein